jgi:hypothetical protein
MVLFDDGAQFILVLQSLEGLLGSEKVSKPNKLRLVLLYALRCGEKHKQKLQHLIKTITTLIPGAEQVNLMLFMDYRPRNTEYSLQIVDSLLQYAGQGLSSSIRNPLVSLFQDMVESLNVNCPRQHDTLPTHFRSL